MQVESRDRKKLIKYVDEIQLRVVTELVHRNSS